MYNNKRFLAIIPARSGSRGVKDKNIKELNGKPMITYTIEAAQKSGIFDTIIVSTDSERYANISREYGVEVPFLRPDELASDTSSSMDVIEHVIIELGKSGQVYDYFMLLQPTSPLRDEKDIVNALELLFEKKAKSIISVCEAEHSPLHMNTIGESLSIDNFIPKTIDKRRQELPKYYRLNGAIYLCDIDYFVEYKDFYNVGSYAYIMNKNNSIDVDDEIDFKLAEIFLLERERSS